jgi:iron(III) transport system substrate-binding protein
VSPGRLALCAVLAGSMAAAQEGPETVATYGPEDAPVRLLVQGAVDVGPFAPALEGFLATAPDVQVRFEEWNSNELYRIAEAACRGEAPPADLLVSSSVDLLVKLVNDGCAQPHSSPATAALPAERNWRDEVFGITSEPAVMVYNRALVPPGDAPGSRFDLLDLLRRSDGTYAGRIATYDLEGSGIGYLFAFLDSQQATTFGSLIEAFGRAEAVATCCSAQIIDGVAAGRYLIAYNVLGSYALARAAANPDLAVVAPGDYTLLLSRGVMIPEGAANPGAAGALVDFLLSDAGREAMEATFLTVATGSDGAPVLPGAPEVVRPIPLSPVLLVGLDRQKREQLLALWHATFPK